MSARIWLRHPDTGGYFHCPADAVNHWKALGYVESDAPKPRNPVTANTRRRTRRQSENEPQPQQAKRRRTQPDPSEGAAAPAPEGE